MCPWTNMSATLHIYFPLHFYCSQHRDPTLLHKSTKFNKLQHLFTIKLQICARNKYAPQMIYIGHIPKLLEVHQWGKYANIYATYELTGINHVIRSTVHRCYCWWWWCHSPITYTEMATWQNHSKNCNLSLPCYIHMCVSNKYAPQMPHMSITFCANMRQLHPYIYLI